MKNKLDYYIDLLLNECLNWIDMTNYKVIDPIENKQISSHYVNSHVSASLIINGKLKKDKELYEKGVKIIEKYLQDWPKLIVKNDR